MYFAMGVEPTNETALMPGCLRIASTASLSPWMTLNTPSGTPASLSSSAMRKLSVGSRSEGFRMNVLPQASAIGNIHIGTIAGKLKGVIPAQTPTGCRSEKLSTSLPTLSLNSPLMRCGIPVANSTTSMPRVIEPSASTRGVREGVGLPPIQSGSRSSVVRSMGCSSSRGPGARAARLHGFVQARDVTRHQVDFEIDSRAACQFTQCRCRQCMRDQIHRKVPLRHGVDGQADAVDGDRPFGRNEAQQRHGRLDLEHPASVGG